MTTTTATVEQRVQAGAAWLDEHETGWVDRIDLDRLSLEHCKRCVLGQVFGDYYDAPLAGAPYSTEELYAYADAAQPLGFTGTRHDEMYGTDEEYAELTEAWRQLIETRRAGAA